MKVWEGTLESSNAQCYEHWAFVKTQFPWRELSHHQLVRGLSSFYSTHPQQKRNKFFNLVVDALLREKCEGIQINSTSALTILFANIISKLLGQFAIAQIQKNSKRSTHPRESLN
jgi:capsule polysaccharide modification protein KpsS